MLRQSLLFLSDSPTVRKVVTETPISRRLAERFIAGDTLADAIRCSRTLNAAGLTVSLDHLGELVTTQEEALSATEMAIRSLEALSTEKIRGNVSLKPTQLGLAIDESFCLENVE